MPPKLNPRKTTASQKKKTAPSKAEDVQKENTASGLDQDAEDQFELELCWCIQQLETCLASGKLQGKQAVDLAKNVNVLRSNTAPLIKKRQVMRNTLGNYREKMAMDERKLCKTGSSVKFSTSSTVNKKSLFLRKAVSQSVNTKTVNRETQSSTDDTSTDPTDSHTFRFNFSQ